MRALPELPAHPEDVRGGVLRAAERVDVAPWENTRPRRPSVEDAAERGAHQFGGALRQVRHHLIRSGRAASAHGRQCCERAISAQWPAGSEACLGDAGGAQQRAGHDPTGNQGPVAAEDPQPPRLRWGRVSNSAQR